MRSMRSIQIGSVIGKLLFVKNRQVDDNSDFLFLFLTASLFICFHLEPPGPISNAGISTTKNGVTRLLRRGRFSCRQSLLLQTNQFL